MNLFLNIIGSQSKKRRYAVSRLSSEGISGSFKRVSDISNAEGFRITQESGNTVIEASNDNGYIYGATALIDNEYTLNEIESPVFNTRGTTLPMFLGTEYDAELSPATFPWFFDKSYMTETLDLFAQNRFNTIFLWASHLFPYILEMPLYPEASAGVAAGQVAQNQEQFIWFTNECERRNITVLVHMYNIHVSQGFADYHGITTRPTTPTTLLENYTKYALDLFFEKFSSVGLYICPGESLLISQQVGWFTDVIFQSAIDSGKNPKLIIRDWYLGDTLKNQLSTLYGNCYTELKHNDESVLSPYPDVRHLDYAGLTEGHIINANHGPAMDIIPLRWANHTFFKEMAERWDSLGVLDGIEVWGRIFWDYQYTYDNVTPRLETNNIDAPYYKVLGRYLWKYDRTNEDAFWESYYTDKFGNATVGQNIANWYKVSGCIGPGLININATKIANWWSAVILMNQDVDDILTLYTNLSNTPYVFSQPSGQAQQRYYPQPFDDYFFQRYRTKFSQPNLSNSPTMYSEFAAYNTAMGVSNLANRICLPTTQYAPYVAAATTVDFALTPDNVLLLLEDLASDALGYAQAAIAANSDSQFDAELARFESDSNIYVSAVSAMKDKQSAAIMKAVMLYNDVYPEQDKTDFLALMSSSVTKYQTLKSLGEAAYTEAGLLYNWADGLAEFQSDLTTQTNWINSL